MESDASGSMVRGVAYWNEERRPQILPSLAFFVFGSVGGGFMYSGSSVVVVSSLVNP